MANWWELVIAKALHSIQYYWFYCFHMVLLGRYEFKAIIPKLPLSGKALYPFDELLPPNSALPVRRGPRFGQPRIPSSPKIPQWKKERKMKPSAWRLNGHRHIKDADGTLLLVLRRDDGGVQHPALRDAGQDCWDQGALSREQLGDQPWCWASSASFPPSRRTFCKQWRQKQPSRIWKIPFYNQVTDVYLFFSL